MTWRDLERSAWFASGFQEWALLDLLFPVGTHNEIRENRRCPLEEQPAVDQK